ncbi:MAG: polysaccharide biosynthesis C-terminal domain-containing protein [Lachnospiraceae bacterium]
MRSKQALRNIIANILLQVIICLSGIILPRIFIGVYGSRVNGLVTSITQFLAYLGLAEAGVGTASIVALYKPLAQRDTKEINSVLSATRQYYNKSGMLFVALVLALTFFYPYMVSQQLDPLLIRSMILVLASSTLVDYFLVGKYKVLLTANQQGYIISTIQSVGLLFNVGITLMLIYYGVNVLIVKGVATIIYILRFFVIKYYVKKKFGYLDFHEKPNFTALHQRGAALLHQVVGIVVNNTDIVLLTALLGRGSLLEVSVYSIYNMINAAMASLLESFSNSLTSGFGELVSKEEEQALRCSYSNYEYMFFVILYVATICMGILLLPFISVYTKGITDANYIRPVAAILFTANMFLQHIRVPGLTIIAAYGHFKETKRQAILEAVINLTVSLALIARFGMVGVLFGTVCSYAYRSTEIMIYNARKLVKNSGSKTWRRLLVNTPLAIILIAVGMHLVPQTMTQYTQWIGYAIVTGTVALLIIIGVNYILEPKEAKMLVARIKGVLKKSES